MFEKEIKKIIRKHEKTLNIKSAEVFLQNIHKIEDKLISEFGTDNYNSFVDFLKYEDLQEYKDYFSDDKKFNSKKGKDLRNFLLIIMKLFQLARDDYSCLNENLMKFLKDK